MTAFNSKGRHEQLAIAVQVLQNTFDFAILRCCFFADSNGKIMCKDSKRTCRTIVLLIKPFVDDVLVAVAIVVCENSLIGRGSGTGKEMTILLKRDKSARTLFSNSIQSSVTV